MGLKYRSFAANTGNILLRESIFFYYHTIIKRRHGAEIRDFLTSKILMR